MNDAQCAVDDCSDQTFIQHPVFLCCRHALMVSLNVTDILHATALMGSAASDIPVERASVASDDVWDQSSHQPVVYFLANGDRVKIGVSTNVTARVGTLSLRKGNALVLLQGSYELEAALHSHFGSDRIDRTEWFILSNRIRAYIADRKEAQAALRQPRLEMDEVSENTPFVEIPEPRKRAATADERIIEGLQVFYGQRGAQPAYAHKDQISALAGIEGSTFDNTLSRLVKVRKIHRQMKGGKEVRGYYGLGPAPEGQ